MTSLYQGKNLDSFLQEIYLGELVEQVVPIPHNLKSFLPMNFSKLNLAVHTESNSDATCNDLTQYNEITWQKQVVMHIKLWTNIIDQQSVKK